MGHLNYQGLHFGPTNYQILVFWPLCKYLPSKWMEIESRARDSWSPNNPKIPLILTYTAFPIVVPYDANLDFGKANPRNDKHKEKGVCKTYGCYTWRGPQIIPVLIWSSWSIIAKHYLRQLLWVEFSSKLSWRKFF
jgi:hypothetical protein